jgi:hypothetical protein
MIQFVGNEIYYIPTKDQWGCQPQVNTKKYFDGRRLVVVIIIISSSSKKWKYKFQKKILAVK